MSGAVCSLPTVQAPTHTVSLYPHAVSVCDHGSREKTFAIGNVGGRARSWRPPRLCEFAGWELVHAASSMVAALLQLLVANVLTDCFMLCNCGATLHQSTGTNAACQRHWCLRPS